MIQSGVVLACLLYFVCLVLDLEQIGVDFALKVINWDADTLIRLQLWDIAGRWFLGSLLYYPTGVDIDPGGGGALQLTLMRENGLQTHQKASIAGVISE